jgi:Flp pilus assembly protein TadG
MRTMADPRHSGTCPQGRLGRARRRLAARNGQALVEFALVIPLVLLLIFGIIDFGKAFNYYNDETSLANQAVRFAEVNNCSPCGGQSVEQYVASTADTQQLRDHVSITFCGVLESDGVTYGKAGDPIRAKVTFPYSWLPYIVTKVGIPNTVTITSTVTGRIESGADYDFSSISSNAYVNSGSGLQHC